MIASNDPGEYGDLMDQWADEKAARACECSCHATGETCPFCGCPAPYDWAGPEAGRPPAPEYVHPDGTVTDALGNFVGIDQPAARPLVEIRNAAGEWQICPE